MPIAGRGSRRRTRPPGPAATRPGRTRSSVDLPHPLGPSKARNSPCRTSRPTSRSTGVAPRVSEHCSSEMRGRRSDAAAATAESEVVMVQSPVRARLWLDEEAIGERLVDVDRVFEKPKGEELIVQRAPLLDLHLAERQLLRPEERDARLHHGDFVVGVKLRAKLASERRRFFRVLDRLV